MEGAFSAFSAPQRSLTKKLRAAGTKEESNYFNPEEGKPDAATPSSVLLREYRSAYAHQSAAPICRCGMVNLIPSKHSQPVPGSVSATDLKAFKLWGILPYNEITPFALATRTSEA